MVTCPNSTTQNMEPGTDNAAVDWSPSPSAVDNVDGLIPNVICVDGKGDVVESGSRFCAGYTTVTCVAVDSSENEGNCSFVIHVQGKSKTLALSKSKIFCGFCYQVTLL